MNEKEIRETYEVAKPVVEKVCEKYKKKPVTFTELLTVAFISLKLAGIISWSWWIIAAVFVVPKFYNFISCQIACYLKVKKLLKNKNKDV